MKAANKNDFQVEVNEIGESCFKNDLNPTELKMQLPLLPDISYQESNARSKESYFYTYYM